MNANLMKKILSLTLSLALLIGNLPINAFAAAADEIHLDEHPEISEELPAAPGSDVPEEFIESVEDQQGGFDNNPARGATVTWSGSGTSSSPYLISSAQQLSTLAQQVKAGNTYSGKYFRLSGNITLTGEWTPIGTSTYKFRGNFDGNNYTISGMTSSSAYSGLFGYVGSGAVIKNVKLTGVSMTGEEYVSGIAAYVDPGSGSVSISNCHVSGSVYAQDWDSDGDACGSYSGGIAAFVSAANGTVTIENCSMTGTADGHTHVGGIIGRGDSSNQKLVIKNCTNHAGIPVGSNANACGGIAGYLSGAAVEGCMNFGNVSGNAYSEDNGSSWLGGIAGSAYGVIFTGCGNYGNISTFYAGGITASQGSNEAHSCLNVGTLTYSSDGYGSSIIYSGLTTNCYSKGNIEISTGAVAHALRDYFGQTIGVDAYPMPLTESNKVYKITVMGEVDTTIYVNYGDIVELPVLNSCSSYFNGSAKFDASTPITRDYALVAKGYHKYVDGVCSYCGNEGVNYLDAGTCGESIAWTLTEAGTLTVSGSGAMTNYTSGSPAPWSSYASSIKTVNIGDGVTTIGNYAFKGLTNVTSVSISKTVTAIGSYAFNGMTGLTAITISDSITSIGDYAFASCANLYNLSMGKQLKTIGAYAFYQCTSLDYLSLPSSVTTLGNGAFRGCTALYRIYLYDKVTSIGSYALAETALTSLDIPASVTSIGGYALANCSELLTVTFKGTAPTITSTAFTGTATACHVPNYDSSWTSKVNTNYGGTLTWSMGSGTLGNGTWVLDFNGTLTVSGTGDMYNASSANNYPWYSLGEKVRSLVISEGVTSIGDNAFNGFSNLTSVTLPSTVTRIGTTKYTGYSYGRSFGNCTSLTQITIPQNVKEIAYATFYGCTSLTTISVASGNTAYSSENGILYDRYKYTLHTYPIGKTGTVTIPASVDEIAPYAFIYCDNLIQITIPSGVTVVEEYAFGYCDNLTHITFQGSAPTIDNYAFYSVTATVDYPTSDTTWASCIQKSYYGTLTWNAGSGSCGTNVQWKLTYQGGSAVLTISGTGAMADYTRDTQPWKAHISSIKTVEVLNGVTSVGAYAFSPGSSSTASTSLTTVKLADSVTSIGDSAFSMCTKLSSLTLGNGIKTIGDSAFSCCAISSINFPNSLQTIGQYAFQSNYSLKSITFGSNLKTIGYTAFAGCSALQTVDLGTSVTTLEQSAFSGCSKLTKIIIPASVTSIGEWTFRNCTGLSYVEFLGNAPSTFNSAAFTGTTCHAYYLSSKSGWSSSNLTNHGGTLTWGAISQRGTCGSNAEWILDTNGNLLICGSGSMPAYSATSPSPWYNYRTSIKKVTFKGVTSIGAYAFNGCSALTTMVVPTSISSVGTYAFADCANLQVVIFEGSAPSFGTNAFSGDTCEIWYISSWSSSVRKDYGGTLTWRKISSHGTCGTDARWALDSTGTLVVLGTGEMKSYASLTTPWDSVNASIKSVVIGGKITKIGYSAFWGCTALQTLTIGDSVTTIDSYAFNGCDALQSVTISDSVTTIGTRAFSYCDGLKTVTIGAKVSSIDSMAFAGCKALTSVTFIGNAPGITYNAFDGVTATVYYPMANSTWTSGKLNNYYGTLTWVCTCTRHKETVAAATAPTCTDTGLTEGKYCSICSEVLVAQEVIPANGHFVLDSNGTEVPADSVTADCFQSIMCTVCGKVGKEAAGHRVLGTVYTEADPLTISNKSSTPFTFHNGVYTSSNKNHSSSADLLITAKYDCTLTINYGVSSEEDYDKLYILVNGSTRDYISGEDSNNTINLTLKANDVVTVRYKKDSSSSEGQDCGWAKLIYSNVMVPTTGDVPADTAEPTCTDAVVCKYCQTVVKDALGHRVILREPVPENPIEVVNSSEYPFTLAGDKYYSSNHGVNSVSELQFNVKANGTITLNYGVSCEATYDKLTVELNSAVKDTISGTVSSKTLTLDVNAGDVVVVRYSKDSGINQGDDQGWVAADFECEVKEEIVPADSVETDCDGVTCDFCHALVKEGLGHSEVIDEGYAPTCTEDGLSEGKHCSVCGVTLIAQVTVPSTGHTEFIDEGYAPTCTEDGLSEGKHCSVCSVTLVAQETVPSTGHTEVIDAAKAPTCTETGLTEGKHCSVCNTVLVGQETVPSTGHSHEAVVTAPTCTEDGFTTYTCHCGDAYVADPVVKLGHDMGEWAVTLDPTCTEAGTKQKDCSRCDHFETEAIPAVGHAHEAVVTAPTCTEDGYTTYTCHCGDTYVADPVEKLGHDMGQWSVINDPTCTVDGTNRRDCSRCDHFETEAIPAVGHAHEAVVTAPTCTEDGYTTYTCHCGDTYVADSVEKLGHDMGEWVVTLDPTCIAEGSKRADCSRCDHFETAVIPTVDHSMDTSNTCTVCGYIGGKCGENLTWTLKDGVLTISGTGEMERHSNESNVHWFLKRATITSVVVREGVTSISSYAFQGCSRLQHVQIPGSVTKIGYSAFKDCTNLESINIPEGVTVIDTGAFQYCTKLKEIDLPNGLKKIGYYAFYGCQKLTDIDLPESLTEIGQCAFTGCSSLTNITIPEGVAVIEDTTFSGCSSLTSIELPANLIAIGGDAFNGCTSLQSIKIPASVEVIEGAAFSGCSSLTNIELPENLLAIGGSAFNGCKSLQSINIPANVTAIERYVFGGCRSLTNIVIPAGVVSIDDYAFYDCSSLTSVQIPAGVTSIGNHTFDGCSSLVSIQIPEGITSIGDYAFGDCSSLVSIQIPAGVTSIGASAFSDCSSLVSIQIPAGVTSIGASAFYGCSSLTSVQIPAGVTSIGNYAFYYCSSLTSVQIPAGVTSIDDYTFAHCHSLASVQIPAGVTSIGDHAFYNCHSMESIQLPEGITSIGDHAFYYCSVLTSVQIPAGVTNIGIRAFDYCNITDVYFGGSAAQWSDFGENAPTATYIHHNCTDATNHWIEDHLDPTCAVAGYTRETCTCGYIRNEVPVPATGNHTFDQETVDDKYLASAVTCTAPAAYYVSCSVCGAASDEDTFQYGEPTGHKMDQWNVIEEPTCAAEGTKRRDCENCDHFETEAIPATGDHVYDRQVVDEKYLVTGETCTTKAVYHLSCVCGAVGTETFVDNESGGHKPDENHECTVCGYIGGSCGENVLWEFDQDLGKLTISGEGTITSSPWRKAYKDRITKVVIRNGITKINGNILSGIFSSHNLTDIVIPDSVTSIGMGAFLSSKIENVYYDGTAEAWTNLSNRPSATFVHYECTDPTSHWSADHLDPTCGVPGYDRETCACGYERNRTEIPATGDHVYDQEVVDEKYLVSAATCTAKAVYRYSCECGAEGEETFKYGKPNGHTHESVVTAPTCTEDGYTTYTCHCGDTYVADEVNKLGHDMGQWSVTLDPTCTVEGSKRADCSRCDHFETEAIPAVGHAHKAAVTAPTCTEKGYTTYTCHCGDTYVADYVAAAHNFGAWNTAENKSSSHRTCLDCGSTETGSFTTIASGICGESVNWSLTSNGMLWISGTGTMPDWNSASATPWYTHRNITVSVTLDGRFENLGNYAFHSNTQIGMVSIPATISRIGSNVFGGCTSLNQIIFEGDAPAFASNAFAGAAVTAYYPAGNSSWAKDVLQNYGGTVTWCSYSKLPSITSQPESVVAAVGKMLNFTVNATGDGLTYQWQYRTSMTGTWKATTLSGAKTATLKVSVTTARNGYQYRCIITDANGSKITSNAVTLTVKPGPTIITQPKSVTANLNDSVSFTVEATGDGLTYQWQYRSSATGTWYSTTLSGNKTTTIKTTATEARNGYQYRCVITDTDGNKVTSNEATLTVKPGPVITSQPVSVTAKVGETVKFTVTATGEGLTYQWQWRKDDASSWAATTVSGSKSSSITVPATAARNGYQYRCVVTDEGGNKVTSNAATLTVKTGPVITSQPVSVTAKVGETVKFTVAATGEGLTYQWQYRSSATGTWYSTTLSGNKTATIQATATEARNGYQYRCVITDADGNKVTSNAATLTVKTSPVITSQPVSVTAKVGDTVKFTVAATGEGLTYQWQWRKDASSAWAATTVSGNKTATITVSATEARNGYQYRCVITDADGNKVTSNAATLTVKAGLSITSQPVSITAAVGKTAKFTVVAAGEGLTYQWQWRKDASSAWAATTVSGNKTATISVPVTAARNSYQYRCKITDVNGNVIYSSAVTLTVK